MDSSLETARATYAEAASAFLDLAERVPLERYAEPGLGSWDLRSLIGHTGRSLVTVVTYLDTRAEEIAAEDAADYFALVSRMTHGTARDAVHLRGIEAGIALGEDPIAALRAARGDAEAALDLLEGEDPVVDTAAGGMRVSDYLPTRTFELTVHCLDIARATGLDFTPPAEALADTLALASASALRQGHGVDVVLALTGRQPLPAGASVVP
ncbi:mycothiol maleylpyruvate isomerase [Nocardioides sp. MAH-18]|uniref:Mycothiol maleylpyruvate isomerase n=1 Tax=Nocardioides agri TaxID=2682843 RepID=A0A6L6XZH8_9ACTN|nr:MULTISPECIES: maleylpyruvate isomerase N-terminal domain-containing protein [unclassified Nocardioides]MBA2955936.1 maleylpyruvate isomerase N-terminal domain-containing protein [Nocardioides sp. CGMCC 1.13656]MVQ50785.1 mycothiol maleylpyruvate isomerase [Nocardioides sp. MAH-18]